MRPHKGPNPFILTYKLFEMEQRWESVPPPVVNPTSAAAHYVFSSF